MLNRENINFYNSLFSNNKVIIDKNNIEKNISEELLTTRTLVLIRESQLSEALTVQLDKILAACKLQKGTYKVEWVQHPWQFYRDQTQLKEVLLFGVTEADLNINIQLIENQINKFDGRIFVKTADISQVAVNQDIKNALWQNALKPHFIGQPDN